MPTLGASELEVVVLTHREGVLSSVGHDLKIRATSLRAMLADDASSVEVVIDARALEVACAMRGAEEQPGAISASDRRDIEGRMAKEVLQVSRHPEIRFRSTSVERAADRATVQGELTLRGKTRPLALALRRSASGAWDGELTLRQTDFGIEPYRAMLGALRVRDEVVVRVSLSAAAAAAVPG